MLRTSTSGDVGRWPFWRAFWGLVSFVLGFLKKSKAWDAFSVSGPQG